MQAPDLSKVHTVGGDYDLGELEEIMVGDALIGGIYDRWKELHDGRKTVIFATGVQHSLSIVKKFHDQGVRAAHLDGNTPETLRRDILQRLEDGELQVVSNCQILTEGWDQPSVKCIILARPTKSLVLYMQMCGRPLRPCCECGHPPDDHDKGACMKCGCLDMKLIQPLILDHAGNYDRHRAPHIDREWSLDVPPKHPKESKFKTCPQCFAYIPSNARECPHCKHSFVVVQPFEPPKEHNVPLVERKPVGERRSFFEKLVREARANGYKPGYVSAKYKEQYEIWPPWSWSEEVKDMYAKDPIWQGRLSRKEEWRMKRAAEEGKTADERLIEMADAAMREWDSFYVAWCTEEITNTRFLIRNVGNIATENRHFKAGIRGQCDVYGWLFRDPYPMEFEIELKNVKTPQNDAQKAWAAYCVFFKIPYVLLRAKKGETPYRIVERWVKETKEWIEELKKR
jgi:hypothetical protein